MQAQKNIKGVYTSDREMPKLRCPECNARLLDAASKSVRYSTRLFVYTGDTEADYVIRCRGCKSAIGLKSTR